MQFNIKWTQSKHRQKSQIDISPKKITDGQQTHEKMLNITNYSVQLLSRVQLFETLSTAAHQASLSITNS